MGPKASGPRLQVRNNAGATNPITWTSAVDQRSNVCGVHVAC